MGRPRLFHAMAAVAALALSAAPTLAQSPAAPPAQDRAKVEDRVFALVQAHKCGQAKLEAERGNDPELAEQIGQMCGLSPGATSAAGPGGGGRRGGGGQGQGGQGAQGGLATGRRGGP